MAADPLKRRGEAGMSIFLWSFPMDFWDDATAPVAHLGRKLFFAPQAAVGRAPATGTASVVLRRSERASHRSAHWRNPRNLDPEFLPGVAGTAHRLC
jgi:hypothetical protein